MCEERDHRDVIRQDRVEYQPHPASVTWARRRVREVLEKWGYAELALEAELVTAELSGNAVLHGCVTGDRFWVRVTVAAAWLRVEVGDSAVGEWPQPRVARADSRCGRGLAIVRHLTHRYGVSCSALSKAVWCEFDLTRTTMAKS
ncbi:ATP-binding protein [Streptomyces sp. 6N223]|uniref:ATP-binding protein n=1 Tax=Streptomyces sp. 6N223 TaxID=3457412 RepID=UPI003FD2655C